MQGIVSERVARRLLTICLVAALLGAAAIAVLAASFASPWIAMVAIACAYVFGVLPALIVVYLLARMTAAHGPADDLTSN